MELELRSLLEMICKSYSEEGQERDATCVCVGSVFSRQSLLEVMAGRSVPWDSQNVIQVHGACGTCVCGYCQ